MDPVVRTSFIPKKAAVQAAPTQTSGGGAGIFFFLSLIIFLASVLLAGGAFAYEQYLKQSIAAKSDSLIRARAAFEPATIQDLMRLDKRLREASRIIDRHTAPSVIFDLLSKTTLASVAFDKFELTTGIDGKGVLGLHGLTRTFSEVALQSDAMGAERNFKNVLFSGFAVAKTGGVEFNVTATIDPAVMSYRANIDSITKDALPVQPQAQPQAEAQATSTSNAPTR